MRMREKVWCLFFTVASSHDEKESFAPLLSPPEQLTLCSNAISVHTATPKMSSQQKTKTLKSKMPKFGFLKRTPKKPKVDLQNSAKASPKHKKDKENMNIVTEKKTVLSRESSKLSTEMNSKIPVYHNAKNGKEIQNLQDKV